MEMDESQVLVSGAVEVHLFGYYTIVFVSGDSVWVDAGINKVFFFQEDLPFISWRRYWPCKSCWNTTWHHISLSFIKQFFFKDIVTWNAVKNFSCEPGAIVFTPFLGLAANCIDPLFSLRGECLNIFILSHGVQKHSYSRAEWSKADQNDNKLRLFWGSIVKSKLQSLTSLAFMQFVPGANQVAAKFAFIACIRRK